MWTYPNDTYDDHKYRNIGFSKYNDSDYCIWLEDLAIKLLTKNKYIEILDFEKKLEHLGVGLDYSEDLHSRIEDKKIRVDDSLLENYPLCLVDPYPQEDEDVKKINEWEIHVVAKMVQEILNKTNYRVRSKEYKSFLKKLKPYRYYFLKQTWERLKEPVIAQYFSVRIDKNIPWSEINNHPDNIVYDLTHLVWADKPNERFLSIDANLNEGKFDDFLHSTEF